MLGRLLLLGLMCGASVARAATDVACWNRDIERIDYFQSPPERGDNNFFTSVSNQDQNTNVVLVYSATTTMKDFTQKLYRIRADLGGATPTGCTNTYFNGLGYFMPTDVPAPAGAAALQGTYSSAKTYPDPGTTYSGGSGQSDGLSNASAYRYGNWGANGAGIVAETVANACTLAGGGGQTAACQACVNSRGYWLNPLVAHNDKTPAAAVFSGNFLRFHPPKWTMLSLAYKRLVNGPLLSVLREAVVGQNGTNGGKVVQKMLPQSCAGQGRPMNQKLGAIDGLSYTSNANPLAEMIFNAGWFMAGQPTGSWPFANAATRGGAAMSDGKSGPCNDCNGDFIVVFSDGRGDTANPACTQVAGVTPPQCSAPAQCSTLGMGPENDGNDFLDPAMAGGTATEVSGPTVRQTPGGTCELDFADDVSRWLWSDTTYSSAAGTKVRTFVVGIGDPNNTYGEMSVLPQIASGGNGQYVVADNFRDLENNINLVMTTIINRATSFSAAAVTTVQSTGYTSALIPRFLPNGGTQWKGSLLRFQLFNEFSAGCSPADLNVKNARNPNGNNSCYEVYLTDKNNNFVGEDPSGAFVQLNTSATWDAGWPIIGDPDAGTTVPAVPAWEASTVLTSRVDAVLAGDSSQARQIYTVAPQGSSGQYAPALVDFTVANAATIAPLLQLGGVTGDLCTTLGFRTRHTYVTEADCAADVIRFIHGEDVLLQNPYNRTIPAPVVKKARPNVLGDIFHSSPILVTPPLKTYLCDLGIANQCVASLYLPTLTSGGPGAYQSYVNTHQYRTQVVLVGANDGMVHAFTAGEDTVSAGVHSFDLGTGKELWAFVPPEVLPKLIRYVIGERHELLLDGTPMVRDVWVDGSGAVSTVDRMKTSDEYHTLAVIGQREGGRSYVALDVTNPVAPRFRWTWPPPGTAESLNAGESWNDIGPGAPAIGPIAEFDSAGTFKVRGDPARERYVVAVGGGYDPALLRGRGVHILDAWTGQTVYRFSAADATVAGDPRTKLFPIAAPPSLVDSDSDGLFDVAVAADIGGQVWALSLASPGRIGIGGTYDNWFGARSFVQFKNLPFWRRNPFFQRPVAAMLPSGEIRVLLGSGDRDQMKDPNGGTCSLANLSACLRKNCSVTVNATRYRVGAGSEHFAQGRYQFASSTNEPVQTLSVDSSGQSNACANPADAQLDYTITCGATTSTFTSPVYCDWGTPECPIDLGRPPGTKIVYTAAVSMEPTRFYSFKLFDSGSRRLFFTDASASTYDGAALSDIDLANAASTTAAAGGPGWYVAQNHSIDEKTSSSALVVGGCALWNTLQPTTAVGSTCGGTASLPLDTAYSYQGDAVTGAIACGMAGSSTASAAVRSVPRSTYVAPQQPSLVISVNAQGKVAYGAISLEPGASPQSTNTGSGNVSGGVIHWLEVPRQLHDCRHNGVNCN